MSHWWLILVESFSSDSTLIYFQIVSTRSCGKLAKPFTMRHETRFFWKKHFEAWKGLYRGRRSPAADIVFCMEVAVWIVMTSILAVWTFYLILYALYCLYFLLPLQDRFDKDSTYHWQVRQVWSLTLVVVFLQTAAKLTAQWENVTPSDGNSFGLMRANMFHGHSYEFVDLHWRLLVFPRKAELSDQYLIQCLSPRRWTHPVTVSASCINIDTDMVDDSDESIIIPNDSNDFRCYSGSKSEPGP